MEMIITTGYELWKMCMFEFRNSNCSIQLDLSFVLSAKTNLNIDFLIKIVQSGFKLMLG